MIRPATMEDAPAVAEIYNHYVEHTVVTFEESLVDAEESVRRMAKTLDSFPFYVFEDPETKCVLGYACAGTWKKKSAYRFSVESTIYLRHDFAGKGIGSALYQALLDDLKERGVHLVIGGIALPNEASVRLHEKFGFQKVAHFGEAGRKFEEWQDVGYWELKLGGS